MNDALDIYFPSDPHVRIIAEPGRYMVASAFTLAVNIIAKRTVTRDGHDEPSHMYYVNDGVYGSFNCVMYDHAHPEARVISVSLFLCYCCIDHHISLLLLYGPSCFSAVAV